MIIASVETRNARNKIRGIVARYMYRIDSKTFIWSKRSIIEDIIRELEKCNQDDFLVIFYVDNKKKETGVEYISVGNMECRKTLSPFFLSIKTSK